MGFDHPSLLGQPTGLVEVRLQHQTGTTISAMASSLPSPPKIPSLLMISHFPGIYILQKAEDSEGEFSVRYPN